MLPDIESKNGRAAANPGRFTHQRVILIGGGANSKGAILLDPEPSPAGAEAGRTGLGKLLLKGIKGTESGVDGRGKVTRRLGCPAGSDHFPEKAVVVVAASVVAKGSDVSDLTLQFFQGQCGQFGVAFEGRVEVGHVGIVMLAVVDLHGGLVDVGLKSVVGVTKFRKSVRHDLIGFDFIRGGTQTR